MKEITMNRTKNTVKASAHLIGGAYKCALALVSAYDGEIVKSADKLFHAKFKDAEIAEKFKNEWKASYASAHAAYVPKSEHTPKKPNNSKSKPSSSKKGNAKLSGKEWVKANPSCTREQAAAHGLKYITKQELKALKKELGVR